MNTINKKNKVLLFSLKHDDFELSFFPCGTNGGQHANRTSSGCRIFHKESGAVAEGREYKSQGQNKEAAFKRLVETKEFKNWHRLECARRMLGYQSIEKMIEDNVDKALENKNLKIEIRDASGKWITINNNYFEQSPEINDNEFYMIGMHDEK